MDFCKLRIFKIFLFVIFLFCSAKGSHADFLQTSNYYQSSDGFARVIPTDNGIYFLLPKTKYSVQEFVLTSILEGLDAFLEFDRALNRFVALHVGSKRYEVRGSFSLIIGVMTIKVDNFANPYCTVEVSPPGQSPSILAFQGITAVANYVGRSAVAILSANQIFENLSDIRPYVLSDNEKISLGENELSVDYIGIDIQVPESPCLNAILLKAQDMANVRQNKDPVARKAQLEDAIKRNKVNILKDLILLKATKSIIALDPRDSTIKSITLVNNDPKICEIKNIDLS